MGSKLWGLRNGSKDFEGRNDEISLTDPLTNFNFLGFYREKKKLENATSEVLNRFFFGLKKKLENATNEVLKIFFSLINKN
ncbi:unnamed protein product [Blepharisma stoltei]|uniref:Uncharacterized protein n=1 Tax=Blepharisma stoltei TaxID=1481888 RepID=A0AAU9IFE9_9CILI|nr:unnamed protein product [Blepharisma stoltei]